MPTNKRVYVYCDGGCSGNPGVGGWGVLLIFEDGEQHELMGGAPLTTNNQMEITAAIEALNALDTPHEVTIITDSQYLIGIMMLCQ
jgi:ribonuclease HI